MEKQILIAGFGGQGVLFAGRFLACAGLAEGMQISWLPSYGPEMRGGTANCGVIVSDGQIGSPLVERPDILIAMNRPSLEKYEAAVRPGGQIYCNTSMTGRCAARGDVEAFGVPATQMAADNGISGHANMIMIGTVLRHGGLFPPERAARMAEQGVPGAHGSEQNLRALNLGYNAP